MRYLFKESFRSNFQIFVTLLKFITDCYFIEMFNIFSLLQIFQANIERYFVVTHRFFRPFVARFVRINVRSWYGYISMRVELYGCRLGEEKMR